MDYSNKLSNYHPTRHLIRQARLDGDPQEIRQDISNRIDQPIGRSIIRTRKDNAGSIISQQCNELNSNMPMTKQFGRISSLDSTKTSSSVEMDSTEQQRGQQQNQPITPSITITSNNIPTTSQQLPATGNEVNNFNDPAQSSSRTDKNYPLYGGPNYANQPDNYDDEEDAFEDPPVPYMSRLNRRRSGRLTRESKVQSSTMMSDFEMLDDRQGMNHIDQQFTKAERATRNSIDGISLLSELRLDGKKSSFSRDGKPRHKDKHRQRSKSPSGRHRKPQGPKRGCLGLASRLKLTKKHELIAKLQLSILNSRFVSLKTLDRDLKSFLPKERLALKKFQERAKLMRRYGVLSSIEYRFASRCYETYVCKHATQEANLEKNNNKKCIPYDYNRVVLKTLPDVPSSDYINASYVDSCLKPNAYIAAQGPNENTVEDFWRMVWEQKTFVVVMLTKVFDFIRVMCTQYWPVELNKPERYGNIEVTLLYEEPLADFVIRTIKLTKDNGGKSRENNPPTNADQPGQSTEKSRKGAESTSNEIRGTSRVKLTNEDKFFGDSDSLDNENYAYDSDDTSCSEVELVLDEPRSGSPNLPNVRAPKFVSVKRSPSNRQRHRKRSHSGSSQKRNVNATSGKARSASSVSPRNDGQETVNRPMRLQIDHRNYEGSTSQLSNASPSRPSKEFLLHPFFNTNSPNQDLSPAISAGSDSNSPMTPRTPTGPGLDRSSATRRAVKKKRRARVKNQRPQRTQFLVPSESQLIDDETDEIAAQDEQAAGARTKSNERIIYQFHYNNWASHTSPFINSLLHFRRRVRICMDEMSKSGRTGPAIVHCSNGGGRTGTYLCIDANLELVEEDNVVDVFNYTKKMRQSRRFLIENLEQYKFVYDTIEEALYCGRTWFPVSELHKRLKHKSQRNPMTKQNEYQREYEKIARMASKFSIGDCAGGHRVENREKNRDVSTVPPDNFRPYLSSFQSNDSTDYINAVFVDGYTRSKEYIVTEWPLHRTISDFWSLIYDHDCNSVIFLANPGESTTYPSFLPTEKELRRKFGQVFSVEMVSYTHYPNVKTWIYTINKKILSLTEVIAGVKSEAKTTQVFQITCWPQGHRVPTSTNSLVELMNMVERWRQRTTYGPVCVVSLDGKSRAGVYCAANVAIEQVVQHNEVDVFQAVKTVRRHRPQLIENMTEYKYCYDLILHYVINYLNQTPANS